MEENKEIQLTSPCAAIVRAHIVNGEKQKKDLENNDDNTVATIQLFRVGTST